MKTISTGRMISRQDSDARDGSVVWMPAKSIWVGTMTVVAIVFGPLTFNWSAFALFVVMTAVTICAGHSVGMHRLLIHRSFKVHIWIEHALDRAARAGGCFAI